MLLLALLALTPAPSDQPVQGTECFTRAAAAAEREYGNYYKADWYLDLRAIMQANQISSVELHVGPYDGSVGGGIAAQYDCAEGRLVTLESER